jgi:Spy/CpxP family protein refolding chaperone
MGDKVQTPWSYISAIEHDRRNMGLRVAGRIPKALNLTQTQEDQFFKLLHHQRKNKCQQKQKKKK